MATLLCPYLALLRRIVTLVQLDIFMTPQAKLLSINFYKFQTLAFSYPADFPAAKVMSDLYSAKSKKDEDFSLFVEQ